MKNITLLKALTLIDDKYIEAAQVYRSGRKTLYKQITVFTSVAACICLVILGAIFVSHYFNDTPKHPIVEPKSDFVIENGTLVAYTGAETEITLPDEVITIGSNAFSGAENASGITTITLNSDIKNIDEKAFEGVSALNKINIPQSNDNFIFTDGVLMATDGSINFSLSPEGDIDVNKFIDTIRIMENNVDFIGKRTTFVFGELTIVAQNFISDHDENETYFVIETFSVFGQTFNLYDSKYDSSFSSGYIGGDVEYTLSLTDEMFLYSKTAGDVGYYLIMTADTVYEYETPTEIIPGSSEAEADPTWYNNYVFKYSIDESGRLVYVWQPMKYVKKNDELYNIRYCLSLNEFAKEEGYVTFKDGEIMYHPENAYSAADLYDIERIFNEWNEWVTTDASITDEYYTVNVMPKVKNIQEFFAYNNEYYEQVRRFNLFDEANIPFRLSDMTFSEIEAEFGPLAYSHHVAGGAPVYKLEWLPYVEIRFVNASATDTNGLPTAAGDDKPNRIEMRDGVVYPGLRVGMTADEVQDLVPKIDPLSGDFSISEIVGPYPTFYSMEGYKIIVNWTFPDETVRELEANWLDGKTAQDYWQTHEFNGTVLAFDVIKIRD